MASIDVTDLSREKLNDATFPVSHRSDFRVAFVESVHQGINAHAHEDTSVEICGVLVGSWAKDADGPYAVIEYYIRCNAATQKFAEVTFTHESWAHINQEMDTKYQNHRIIGWYHSHPNFGIFLSDRDCFIQENFFSGPGQVAFVVDPVRKLEGLFEWRQGKPIPMHHYWIGSRVQVGEAQPAPPPAALPQMAYSGEVASTGPDSWSLALSLLLALCAGLLGLMWGSRRTAWEQERLEAGAVAHYGLWKLYKPGFDENFAKLIQAQNLTYLKLQRLAEDQIAHSGADTSAGAADGAEEQAADLQKKWNSIYGELDEITKYQLEIAKLYSLSESERRELRELLAVKLEALDRQELSPSSRQPLPQESTQAKPRAKDSDSDKKPHEKASRETLSKIGSPPHPPAAESPTSKPASPQAEKPIESPKASETKSSPVPSSNDGPTDQPPPSAATIKESEPPQTSPTAPPSE